jgi:AcrR family transcriptional regulator
LPKPTFFNLREEKRSRLIDAAREEFSRVSLYEASISNILKMAGIPRGSFYQYFEDKEDAFFFLVGEHARERFEHFTSLLREHKGDLFEASRELFRMVLQHSRASDQNRFMRNVLLNMNYKIEKTFTQHLTKETLDQRYAEVYHLIDRSLLNIQTREDLYHLLQINTAITFHNLVKSISDELTVEEALNKYDREISMIRKGVSM